MVYNFVVGCVGKPSAGKSTFFNAATENSNAKTGAYPFTTIEPNVGICHVLVNCPCVKYKVKCKPHYGHCVDGRRTTPVKLLDVAGLIPGASEGLGLGNKFLDDLRHADVLLHILDVSGTTNEKGEATIDFDPSCDHQWLKREVHLWIFNNLWSRWASISRRHAATNSSASATMLGQLSGYGARENLVQQVLEDVGVKRGTPVDFISWDKEMVTQFVECFIERRFSFILVLNKADMGGNCDRNALKLFQMYGENRNVLCSALAECFLRKMAKQNFIKYREGDNDFTTFHDNEVLSSTEESSLKPLDPKANARLERIRDMVLFRLGSTGVQQALQKATQVAGLIPVFPVRNSNYMQQSVSSEASASTSKSPFFPECILVPSGTTVRKFAKMLHGELERNFLYAEGPGGQRMGENDELTEQNNIIRYVTESCQE